MNAVTKSFSPNNKIDDGLHPDPSSSLLTSQAHSQRTGKMLSVNTLRSESTIYSEMNSPRNLTGSN